MDNEKSGEAPKEPGNSICNRCMSEITGIKDEKFLFNESEAVDIGEIFDHMEFSLDKLHEKIKSNEQQMSLIYKSYVLNDIDILRHAMGLVDYCTCDDHLEDESEEEDEE